MDGVFALAIVDIPGQRLILVNDRLGIRPFSYHVDENGIRFGSELKAIIADPAVPTEIDPLAISLFFASDVIPAPHTIYLSWDP